VPERIGTYEILGELGYGATGIVYRARQASLNREVALKVLSAPLASDPEYVARFHREAEMAAALDHPLIVTVYDTGAAEGCHYIAMRYVRGVTLETALQGRSPDTAAALGIGRQIAEALAYAHSKGIVHRDLKPANVLVTPDGRIALADFGIARAAESTGHSLAGQIIGTPEYMSPEQAHGQPADARSDLYSLGMLLYRMLAGRPAFTGGDVISLLVRQAQEEPPWLLDLNPSVPPAVAEVVHVCLAKERSARYQSATELLAALDEAVKAPAARAAAPTGVAAASPPAEIAALSVDIVRSRQLAQPGAAHAPVMMSAYRALVQSVLSEHSCLGHCWSGDGLLALFGQVDQAVYAGKSIQRALPKLNREQGAAGRGAIRVRAAVDWGEVPWRPGAPVGELTSRALDGAGHLQKAAQPGEVAASWAAYLQLKQRQGFLAGPRSGPLAGAYCWSEWQEQQEVAPAQPSAEALMDPAVASQLKAALAMQALDAPRSEGTPWFRLLGVIIAVAAVSLAMVAIGRSLSGGARRGPHAASGSAGRAPLSTKKTAPAAGAASTALASPSTPLLLPTAGELTWTYAETLGQPATTQHVTDSVGGAFAAGDERLARLASSDARRPVLLVRMRVDGLAVYGALGPDGRTQATRFDPPWRMLPNPIPLDAPLLQEFRIEAVEGQASGTNGRSRVTLTVGGQAERRSVPAGLFTAHPFQMIEEVVPGASGLAMRVEHTGWLAPAAGIIEEQVATIRGNDRQVIARVLEAKSF
jgi:hypothetical protein